VQNDLRAQPRDVAHFDRRRALRHYDRAWDPQARTGERDALGVVPWTVGGTGGERQDCRVCTRAGGLDG
jgi:hypothetical protein